jgi:hypothetical protein
VGARLDDIIYWEVEGGGYTTSEAGFAAVYLIGMDPGSVYMGDIRGSLSIYEKVIHQNSCYNTEF